MADATMTGYPPSKEENGKKDGQQPPKGGKPIRKGRRRTPTPERYDMARTQGPDPRDARAQGHPCWGAHQAMPEGRGSLSGRNGFAMWKVCSLCRLRIEYTPAFGATGSYRQAGPLGADVVTVMTEVKDKIKDQPLEREKLNNKTCSALGAEASLKAKLKKLENDRLKVTPKERPGTSAASTQQTTEESKKAQKRPDEQTAEKKEADTASDWSKVSSP